MEAARADIPAGGKGRIKSMRLSTALSIYTTENRRRLLTLAALLIAGIALADWWIKPVSMGFLYLFPLMIAGGFLSRSHTAGLAVLCAFLTEEFSNLPVAQEWPRFILTSAGFIGTGLLIGELVHNRRMVLAHLHDLEEQVQARREAEVQMQFLVESSPAAIITLDEMGTILLANEAAQQTLAPGGAALKGQSAASYLPALDAAVKSRTRRNFRTSLQCRGQRAGGEVFLAGVWFSTYTAAGNSRLAAIFVDLSEELRSREDLGLDYLLTNTRILMSAVSHEIRNLCGAALVVHRNLAKVEALKDNADFDALSTLIHGLEHISAMDLRGQVPARRSAIELGSVLDELRVLISGAAQEGQVNLGWQVPESLPLVWADRYGLVQIFLNLAKNSLRALDNSTARKLTIRATVEEDAVRVRFEDSGGGVSDPQTLFRPFHSEAHSTGLGLYVSRALVKSFGGDLLYEPIHEGSCFTVVLPRSDGEETGDE